MKRVFFVATLCIICVVCIGAQQTTPPTTSATPNAAQAQAAQREARIAEQNRRRQIDQSFNNLRILSEIATSGERSGVMPVEIAPLYRKPTKSEIQTLQADSRDKERYAEFLKQKNTGIFVLVPDAGCSGSSKVLVVSPECQEYKFPGAGSSYSFRIDNYRMPDLADIRYSDGIIEGEGVLVGKVFVDLGDQPIESIHLRSPALKFLKEYPYSKTSSEAFQRQDLIRNRVTRDGFAYGLGVFAKENTTSAARFIAYQSRRLRSIEGVTYNEFSFDKRRDIIVAFRIVRKDDDGRITIIWKELQNKKAPKIKIVDPATVGVSGKN